MSNLLQWPDVVLLEVLGDEGRCHVRGRGRGPRNCPLLRRALLHEPVVQVGISQCQSSPRGGSSLVGVTHDRLQGDLQACKASDSESSDTLTLFAYFLSFPRSANASAPPQPFFSRAGAIPDS